MADPLKVLLATDGSEASLRAAILAARLLGPPARAEVTILYVRPATTGPVLGAGLGPVEESRLEDQLREAEQVLVEQAAGPLRASGLDPRLRLEAGSPAEVISAVADAESYDLLVVGQPSLSELPPLLGGGVGETVMRNTSIPVLLVS